MDKIITKKINEVKNISPPDWLNTPVSGEEARKRAKDYEKLTNDIANNNGEIKKTIRK
jgi:hypothetical protein